MDEKPHLLVGVTNNLGAETKVHYASSTKFYLDDERAGQPWVTWLPFPVHVVDRVETYDRISRNYFVTSYTYHHGYFDGVEREFRGFGMVEQLDTEELAALTQSGAPPDAANLHRRLERASGADPNLVSHRRFHRSRPRQPAPGPPILRGARPRRPGLRQPAPGLSPDAAAGHAPTRRAHGR